MRSRRKMSTVFSNAIVPPELLISDFVNSTQDLSRRQEKTKTFRTAIPEILASCSATSFHIIVGVTFASTSALMPQLEEPNSDIHATKAELAWIVSIVFIILPVTSIFAGVFMETFGRLNAVRLAVIPSTVSCIIIALATDVYTIIGGRLLFGIAAALGTNPAIVYVTEITSPEYRGALISSGPTLSSLGMLLGYAMGAFLPWRTVSWVSIVCCLIPVVITVFFFVPESPTWLVSKNRVEHARISLNWLYKLEAESNREKLVDRKLKELMRDKEQKLAASRGKPSVWRKFEGLKKPTGYKPLLIMIILFFFQQYTGVYITTFYIVQYFEEAGSKMNPFHASILVGLTRFVMSVVTVYLLKKFGRRPLCITSCIGMGTSATISGYYTHKVIVSGESSMMPVFTILLFVAFSMIGLLSLPWTMAAEVFPTEIRGIAHGLVMATAHAIMFVSLQTYYGMAELFGGHDGLQWFFASMCVLALVFIYFFLPETHGKTLFEIENYFTQRTVYMKGNYEKKTSFSPSAMDRKYSFKNIGLMEALPEVQAEYNTQTNGSRENLKIGGSDVRSSTYKTETSGE
ncbi:hypothetical protein RUM43_006801 [Polyplax serrata]|uniref:Major facilitator superfamily (MFS) profile domain-containing protein n=1 Tax=Polyplax serrata TaxID=468196 RepID=A0AAN8P4V3_POLSC